MTLYLLARIAGEIAAFPARMVSSVVELGTVTPVPRVAPHIAGLCALRSRVLTVIDARAALGLGRGEGTAALAVVVDVAGHGYALAVESVDDVVEGPPPQPCVAALAPAWGRVAQGMVELDGRAVLLVDPAALVEGPEVAKVPELT